jgi:hypothetical protein
MKPTHCNICRGEADWQLSPAEQAHKTEMEAAANTPSEWAYEPKGRIARRLVRLLRSIDRNLSDRLAGPQGWERCTWVDAWDNRCDKRYGHGGVCRTDNGLGLPNSIRYWYGINWPDSKP